MGKLSWFLVPRRESGHVQRANDVTHPLVDRIRQHARAANAASSARKAKKDQWIELAANRRAK
jgi:hypothetical protein